MMVLPIGKALELSEVPMHEDILEHLVEWQPGMNTIFISHTWNRRAHPDSENNCKWALLKSFLKTALAGQKNIDPDPVTAMVYGRKLRVEGTELSRALSNGSGYIWMDFMSVPQCDRQTQIDAIASLHAYVSRISYFVVLAGPWEDQEGAVRDVRRWSLRGWTRLELMSNALAVTGPKPFLLVESPTSIRSYPPGGLFTRGWLTETVGLGDFTVDDDRVKLGPVMSELIEARKRVALEHATPVELLWYRLLHAAKSHLLRGTRFEVRAEGTLAEWMSTMRFESARDGEKSGLTPLLFAAISGRTDLVTALLDAGADIHCRLAKSHPQFDHWTKGSSVMHIAAMHDNVEMMTLLLARGADPRLREAGSGTTPLGFACEIGCMGNIRALLAHDPSLALEPNRDGIWAIAEVILCGRERAFETLCAEYPSMMRSLLDGGHAGTRSGFGLCSALVGITGDPITLRKVAEAGCDVDLIASKKAMSTTLRLVQSVSQQWLRCSLRTPPLIVQTLALTINATAMHVSAWWGNLGSINVLIDAGATVDAHNEFHMTPLHLASMCGHEAIVARLLEAGASPLAKDFRRHTPEYWARIRGHGEVVLALSAATRAIERRVAVARRSASKWTASKAALVVRALVGMRAFTRPRQRFGARTERSRGGERSKKCERSASARSAGRRGSSAGSIERSETSLSRRVRARARLNWYMAVDMVSSMIPRAR